MTSIEIIGPAMCQNVPSDGIEHKGSIDSAWDFFNCDSTALTHITGRELSDDVERAGFGIIREPHGRRKFVFHRFDAGGCGFSYSALIWESHVAIHHSPENPLGFELTIHTCLIDGTGADLHAEEKKVRLFELWKRRFAPHDVVPFAARHRALVESVIEQRAYASFAGYAPPRLKLA